MPVSAQKMRTIWTKTYSLIHVHFSWVRSLRYWKIRTTGSFEKQKISNSISSQQYAGSISSESSLFEHDVPPSKYRVGRTRSAYSVYAVCQNMNIPLRRYCARHRALYKPPPHLCDVLVHDSLEHVQLIVQLDAIFRQRFVSLPRRATKKR